MCVCVCMYVCVCMCVCFLSRNRSKLVNYRLVKDAKSGTFYIYNHTSFPSIHQLLAYYGHTPINREVNTRLLTPISAPQQSRKSEVGGVKWYEESSEWKVSQRLCLY